MGRMTTITTAVIGIGLTGFLVLACVPGSGQLALYVVLLTPLLAALAAAVELALQRRFAPAICMVLAVGIAATALLIGGAN